MIEANVPVDVQGPGQFRRGLQPVSGQQPRPFLRAVIETQGGQLTQTHAPLQELVRAYERRIVELEKQLAQKGEENRHLLEVKIALARNQLAATKERMEFN